MEAELVKKIYLRCSNLIIPQKKSGHGIGMMIIHRIMRDHGGDVGVDSKVGAGTIVTVSLSTPI